MKEIDLRAKAIEGVIYSKAQDCLGIYPMAVSGGDKPYEKRTERMEGWNECAMASTANVSVIKSWLNALPADQKVIVEDLLLRDLLELRVDDKVVFMMVSCNDVFFWGCSDAESIQLSELPDLIKAIEDANAAGATHSEELLWVARKRGERPQGAVYAYVEPALGRLFDACGPFREAGFGNPVASSFESGEEYRKEKAAS